MTTIDGDENSSLLSYWRLIMAEQSSSSAEDNAAPHLAFLDPIRVGLTLLVILHHVSITYGGSGNWYYKETDVSELTRMLLSIFTATNQSFFMGFFFLISGYLMPPAVALRGGPAYLGKRAFRLGVPFLLYGFVLAPFTRALAVGAQGGEVAASFLALLSQGRFDPGPLWFNLALMIGTLVWVCTPRVAGFDDRLDRLPGGHARIALAVLGCAALAFLLRLAAPVGQAVLGMQLGYFASYIILFFGGAWAARHRLLERVSLRFAWPWVIVSLDSFPMLRIFAAKRDALSSDGRDGGGSGPALAYAVWEPLVATGIILGALAFARRRYPVARPWMSRLPRASYAAFVIHPPIAVACSWLVRSWAATAGGRFALAGALACLLAWLIGDALTRGMTKIRPLCSEYVAMPPHG